MILLIPYYQHINTIFQEVQCYNLVLLLSVRPANNSCSSHQYPPFNIFARDTNISVLLSICDIVSSQFSAPLQVLCSTNTILILHSPSMLARSIPIALLSLLLLKARADQLDGVFQAIFNLSSPGFFPALLYRCPRRA